MTAPAAPNPADPPEAPADRPARRRLSLAPRTVTLLVASGAALAAAAAMFSLPVPYVLETPGPTADTLGQQDGQDLIQVDQAPSHEITGQLLLTTVGAYGSEPGSLSLVQLVKGYFKADEALLPYDLLYPRDSTEEERQEQSAEQMRSSQDTALAAALSHLGLDVAVVVDSALTEAAQAALREGDRLVAIDGQATPDFAALEQALAQVKPGDAVEVRVARAGREETVEVVTAGDPDSGQAMLGITVAFDYPVEVTFAVEDIGGPSAGSMLALGIIDKLGPDDLAGGRVIAGTGTVDPAGAIGAIGGVRQKMIGARRDGAEIFLAPEANCDEVRGNVPPGLRVVKVASLDDAVAALAALRSSPSPDLPTCG
ncbi:MAG: PDZ domain-containing protein [Bifidobacteriaceae bacterium]|nr:PDZ domain-containing protein [Bifidobacteriaceae bacterium]